MPTEEEAKKAIDTLNAAKTHTGGGQVDIGDRNFSTDIWLGAAVTQAMIDELYKEVKPVLDRLRTHDTGEEEIKPIKL